MKATFFFFCLNIDVSSKSIIIIVDDSLGVDRLTVSALHRYIFLGLAFKL